MDKEINDSGQMGGKIQEKETDGWIDRGYRWIG